VKILFLQAHEAYLYGFDIAWIALCGSLVEQSLKDKLLPHRLNQSSDIAIEIHVFRRRKYFDTRYLIRTHGTVAWKFLDHRARLCSHDGRAS
jgi:hypothetical protein